MSDKPRFLITTADERSWRTDQPVLFLGEWCRLPERRDKWQGLDAAVVSEYGWGEGQQDADYAYVRDLCEQLLVELVEALNRYHGTRHSLRYWRILLGPWLLTFTAMAFNRWATVQLALRDFNIAGSATLALPPAQTVPNSFPDFVEKYLGHTWNHALFQRILSGWTDVKCERLPVKKSAENISGHPPASTLSLRQRLRHLGGRGLYLFSCISSRPTDAFLISSYLPRKQDFLLQLALGQIPKLWSSPAVPRIAPDIEARQGFCLSASGHRGFEQCIRTLVAEQIPSIYLEGYSVLQKAASELPWPSRPKVIFTSNNCHIDDVFKAWAAGKVEQGSPYVIGQHGGFYGTGRYPSHAENNEVASADRYLTWGWADNDPKHYPGVALKLVGQPQGNWNRTGGLLHVLTHEMRYSRNPWGTVRLQADYMEDQFRFVSLLPERIQATLTVRLHAAAVVHGCPHDVLWQTCYPRVRLDTGTGSIESLIRQSRLIVCTYNSTGFLETLGRNIPTIVFWDPKYNALRHAARPYFDLLNSAGILHDTPESAAAKVAEVWNDVAGWWNRSAIQESRRRFCDRFARLPDNPIQVLKEALTTVKADSVRNNASS